MKAQDRKAVPGTSQSASLQRNKVINRLISRASEGGNPKVLLEVINTNLKEMNGINLATAFHRVAKLAPSSDRDLNSFKRHPTFMALFNAVLEHMQEHSLRSNATAEGPGFAPSKRAISVQGEMPVQCLSIVAWSCATLQIRHRSVFSAIADITSSRLFELKPYELSNLLWAFAKVGLSHCDLFKNVAERLLQRKDGEFKVQCLSTIAWSYSTLKRRNLLLFNSIAKELSVHVAEMKPQEISNTLWAFAKNSYAHAELFRTLGDAISSSCSTMFFKPQEISNSAWAFATVGLQHERLFVKVEEVSVKWQKEMAPQNVANILWAFAKLDLTPSMSFLKAMVNITMRTLPQHKTPELSAVVWAMAHISPENAVFFTQIAQTCVARAQEFSCNGLANLTKALGSVQMAMPECYLALLHASLQRMPHFLPKALITALQGTECALQNPSYEREHLGLREAAAQISAHIASRMHELQPADLRELPSIFHVYNSGKHIEGLSQQDLSLLVAGMDTKRPHSVGSMSTSADDIQEDDDIDQFCSKQIEVLDEPHAVEEIDAKSDWHSGWATPSSARSRRDSDDRISMPSETCKRNDQACHEHSALGRAIFDIEYCGASGARSSGHPKKSAGQPPRVPGRKWTAAMALAAQQGFDWNPWHVPVRSSVPGAGSKWGQADAKDGMPMSVPVPLAEIDRKAANFVPWIGSNTLGQEPMKVVSSYPAYISESGGVQ